MTDNEIELRGHRTRLVDDGAGSPLVLVHGTPFDLGSWDPLVAALAGRRTVRYDVRGHGSAKGVPVPGVAELVADLFAVLDRLDLAAAHLVGHSWGGEIVLRAALDHPERVSRLSLVCTRAAPFPSFHTVADGLRDGTADRTASLARWFGAAELARADPLVASIRAQLVDADTPAWAAALDMIAAFDVLGELPTLAVPVDVVAAEHDGVGTAEHMARIAETVPRGTFQVAPGAYHLLPLQRPEFVAAALQAG
ncbi:MAG TPA: alpha/beta fold hydrolase [Trebonia sp.]